jgi:hypothetical protein
MWIVVLVPPLLRSRSFGRPSNSVGDFRRHLSNLQTNPGARPTYGSGAHLRPVAAYRPSTPAARRAPVRPVVAATSTMRQRRQNILVGLLAIVSITGVIGFGLPSRLFVMGFLISAVLLAGYVYALVQMKKVQQSKAVRYDWSRAA